MPLRVRILLAISALSHEPKRWNSGMTVVVRGATRGAGADGMNTAETASADACQMPEADLATNVAWIGLNPVFDSGFGAA